MNFKTLEDFVNFILENGFKYNKKTDNYKRKIVNFSFNSSKIYLTVKSAAKTYELNLNKYPTKQNVFVLLYFSDLKSYDRNYLMNKLELQKDTIRNHNIIDVDKLLDIENKYENFDFISFRTKKQIEVFEKRKNHFFNFLGSF
jgi:hypothetical protein